MDDLQAIRRLKNGDIGGLEFSMNYLEIDVYLLDLTAFHEKLAQS